MSEPPRLFLITSPVADANAFAPLLETAVKAADIACVLIRTAARDDTGAKAIIRALAPIAQARDVAVLVEGDPRLVARTDADGVHVAGVGPQLREALDSLQPRKKIVGCAGITTRDAAMEAGETGVDYLMFGAPDEPTDHATIVERVSWWSDIFNVPCVGYARLPEDAADIARAGAEFVALGEGLWTDRVTLAATLQAATRAVLALGATI